MNNLVTNTLFSIVQKGKFAACAFAFDKQLKSVDLPTFGSPTIPQHPQRIVPTTVEIVDIAGLVKGASKGEGLGNKFLALLSIGYIYMNNDLEAIPG